MVAVGRWHCTYRKEKRKEAEHEEKEQEAEKEEMENEAEDKWRDSTC